MRNDASKARPKPSLGESGGLSFSLIFSPMAPVQIRQGVLAVGLSITHKGYMCIHILYIYIYRQAGDDVVVPAGDVRGRPSSAECEREAMATFRSLGHSQVNIIYIYMCMCMYGEREGLI